MIKHLKKEHLEECTLLFIKTFNNEPWSENWTYEKAYKRLENLYNTPEFLGFIKVLDNKIAGALFCHTTEWFTGKELTIKELFVDTSLQRAGVGKSLMNHLLDHIKNDSDTTVNLYTLRNEHTISFYEKLGFAVDNDLCIMSKKQS